MGQCPVEYVKFMTFDPCLVRVNCARIKKNMVLKVKPLSLSELCLFFRISSINLLSSIGSLSHNLWDKTFK